MGCVHLQSTFNRHRRPTKGVQSIHNSGQNSLRLVMWTPCAVTQHVLRELYMYFIASIMDKTLFSLF